MQMPRIALVLRFRLEAGNAAAVVVGIEGQVQADGIVDAADEAHAGVGLFSMIVSPCMACIIASTRDLGNSLRSQAWDRHRLDPAVPWDGDL